VINQFGNIAGGGKFVTSPTSVTATASGAVVNVTFVAATYDGKEIATYTVTSIPGWSNSIWFFVTNNCHWSYCGYRIHFYCHH
jgi:uncharacterized protein (UPF0333 family)